MMSEVVEILHQLVAFNTITDKQNQQLLDYVSHYLAAYDFELERIGKCLLARRGQPTLGFIGHTDTVPYADWDGDPFFL